MKTMNIQCDKCQASGGIGIPPSPSAEAAALPAGWGEIGITGRFFVGGASAYSPRRMVIHLCPTCVDKLDIPVPGPGKKETGLEDALRELVLTVLDDEGVQGAPFDD